MEFVFNERQPDSPLVDTFWRTQTEQVSTFTSAAVSHSELVITRDQGMTTLTVRGPETRATPATGPADAEFVGVQLKLSTFMPYLPIGQLVDGVLVLPGASRRAFWFRGSAIAYPDFEDADTFVDKLVRDGILMCDSVVDAVLRGEPPRVSPRTAQRRFLSVTGLSHNTVRQIERAKAAESLLAGGVSIADVVYQAGYADQPHLTRHLKQLTGRTPAQILHTGSSG